MAGLTRTTVVKKVKKHGVKAGQKSLIRPSQKKAVKNGRYQEKEKVKAKVTPKKNVVIETEEVDEMDDFLQEPEFDVIENDLEPDGYKIPEEYVMPEIED